MDDFRRGEFEVLKVVPAVHHHIRCHIRIGEFGAPSISTIVFNTLCAAALFALPTGCVNAQLGAKTGASGMTLYTFDKDQGAESTCYDECAVNWPPYLAKEGASKGEGWGTTDRKDGAKQWTYNGRPVYYYIEDKVAGDTKGDGKGGVWHMVQ